MNLYGILIKINYEIDTKQFSKSEPEIIHSEIQEESLCIMTTSDVNRNEELTPSTQALIPTTSHFNSLYN